MIKNYLIDNNENRLQVRYRTTVCFHVSCSGKVPMIVDSLTTLLLSVRIAIGTSVPLRAIYIENGRRLVPLSFYKRVLALLRLLGRVMQYGLHNIAFVFNAGFVHCHCNKK